MSTEEATNTAAATPIVVTQDSGTLEQRQAFLAAFAAAQGEFQPIVKNRTVTIKPRDSAAYTFRFADMQEIDAKTRPYLAANGLSLSGIILPNEDGKGVWLALVMAHAAGFERRNEVFVTYGDDIKQFGGRLSYMRRYLKTAMLDVTADDDLDDRDDGDGAGGDDTGAAAAPTPPKRTPARKPPAERAPPPAEPPEPPPEEGTLTKEELEEQRLRDEQRQNNAQQAQQRIVQQAAAPAVVNPADNPASGKPPATVATPAPPPAAGETGELCLDNELKYLINRTKNRGGDLRVILDSLNMTDIDEKTLKGLLKSQFKLILSKV